MLNTAAINSINARLNSGDWDVVWEAAIDAFLKSEKTDAENFLLAKAAYSAKLAPGRSFVKFHADYRAKGGRLSRPSLLNYAVAWEIAALTEPADVEPTPVRVAGAYTIESNVKASTRNAVIEDLKAEELKDRGPLLDEMIAGWDALDEAYAVDGPVSGTDSDDESPAEEPTPVVAEEATVAGQLSVLLGIAAQIAAGDRTVAEAYELSKAASAIILAAEAFVSAAAASTLVDA